MVYLCGGEESDGLRGNVRKGFQSRYQEGTKIRDSDPVGGRAVLGRGFVPVAS